MKRKLGALEQIHGCHRSKSAEVYIGEPQMSLH
jgi:hypothetical protein